MHQRRGSLQKRDVTPGEAISSSWQEVAMNTALWTTQAILATIFGASAVYKGTHRKEEIVARGQTGVTWYGTGFIRFVALSELFGSAGLILPWALKIARPLTPLGACGLAIIMVGAAFSHARLARSGARPAREWGNVATNVALLAGCAFVAVERFAELATPS
jgi:hypothetical protein